MVILICIESTWQSRWYKYKVKLWFSSMCKCVDWIKEERVWANLNGKQISFWSKKVIFNQEGSNFKKNIDLDSIIQLHHNRVISLLLFNHCSSDLKSLNWVGLTTNCKSSNKVEIPLNCFKTSYKATPNRVIKSSNQVTPNNVFCDL